MGTVYLCNLTDTWASGANACTICINVTDNGSLDDSYYFYATKGGGFSAGIRKDGCFVSNGMAVLAGKGANNVYVGVEAGSGLTLGQYNTGLGYRAACNITSGRCNTAVGVQSGMASTFGGTCWYNTWVGACTAMLCINGDFSVGIGFCAAYGAVAAQSVFIGYRAGVCQATNFGNVHIGACSKCTTTASTGLANVGVGARSLATLTTGSYNTAIGFNSMFFHSTQSFNTAVGYNSMYCGAGTQANVVVGMCAGYNAGSSGGITAIGTNAALNNTTANAVTRCDGVFIGRSSGRVQTSGACNIAVGFCADTAATNGHTTWGNATYHSVCNCVGVAWSVVSDCRDKTDITQLTENYGLPFINKIKPVSFKWDRRETYEQELGCEFGYRDGTYKGTRNHYGFIAQDIKQAEQELGITYEGLGHDPKKDAYRLTYEEMIAPLTLAVQQLACKVETLENKIN